jgi:hypothetical protein
MNDLCGWPFEQKRMQDEQTLEGMVDGMGLKAILLILHPSVDLLRKGSTHRRELAGLQSSNGVGLDWK